MYPLPPRGATSSKHHLFVRSQIGHVSPIADPLIDGKLLERALKLVRKASADLHGLSVQSTGGVASQMCETYSSDLILVICEQI